MDCYEQKFSECNGEVEPYLVGGSIAQVHQRPSPAHPLGTLKPEWSFSSVSKLSEMDRTWTPSILQSLALGCPGKDITLGEAIPYADRNCQ
jgi:hypothetical protein